jgi:hypothetical protein
MQRKMHLEGSELLPLSASASKKTRTLTTGCLRKSKNAALALDPNQVWGAATDVIVRQVCGWGSSVRVSQDARDLE